MEHVEKTVEERIAINNSNSKEKVKNQHTKNFAAS